MSDSLRSLQIDTLMIEQWRARGFDYEQEFVRDVVTTPIEKKSDLNLNFKWLEDFFKFLFDNESLRTVCFIILIVLIVALFLFLLHAKFSEPATRRVEVEGEDTIYGIDFDGEIAAAEQREDYYQCIRMRYLKLLRLLQDSHHILWEPGKTVTQYTTEVNHPPFATLTRLFVRIRYGNYPASLSLYTEARTLADEVDTWVAAHPMERKEMAQ